MIVVPMEALGVKIFRMLSVFGYDHDADYRNTQRNPA